MGVLVVRHELSEANNRDNYGTPVFGHPEAPLMQQGADNAPSIGVRLYRDYGIKPYSTVAVSMMRRTQQTAILAGFRHLSLYSELNELRGLHSDEDIRKMIDDRNLAGDMLLAVNSLIVYPLNENVWFTHGLVIAALCQSLNVYQDDRFIPKFGEIRELPLKI